MCLHNSLAHGLIMLYKTSESVKATIDAHAAECEFFRIIIAAIYQVNSTVRNNNWLEFILRITKWNYESYGMEGNVSELADTVSV